MSGYLPYGRFKKLKNFDGFHVNSISEKGSIAYILEVDLEYPDELHALRNDYSLTPEKLTITYDVLSDYCKKIADKYEIKVVDVKRLIPNLDTKTYYRNLQFYLSLGMKLNKTHRVLKFKQSDWMRKYIEFNTEKIINAANSFEKDFFGLMINSFYGKTMERVRKTSRLVINEKDFLKRTSRPAHITHKIFDKKYAAIHEIKPFLTLNKPIYVAFTILELSKWLMYDFHYSFIKNILMLNYYLLTQTVLLMESKDVYEEFFKHKHLFDFSNCPKDSKLFDEKNKKFICE